MAINVDPSMNNEDKRRLQQRGVGVTVPPTATFDGIPDQSYAGTQGLDTQGRTLIADAQAAPPNNAGFTNVRSSSSSISPQQVQAAGLRQRGLTQTGIPGVYEGQSQFMPTMRDAPGSRLLNDPHTGVNPNVVVNNGARYSGAAIDPSIPVRVFTDGNTNIPNGATGLGLNRRGGTTTLTPDQIATQETRVQRGEGYDPSGYQAQTRAAAQGANAPVFSGLPALGGAPIAAGVGGVGVPNVGGGAAGARVGLGYFKEINDVANDRARLGLDTQRAQNQEQREAQDQLNKEFQGHLQTYKDNPALAQKYGLDPNTAALFDQGSSILERDPTLSKTEVGQRLRRVIGSRVAGALGNAGEGNGFNAMLGGPDREPDFKGFNLGQYGLSRRNPFGGGGYVVGGVQQKGGRNEGSVGRGILNHTDPGLEFLQNPEWRDLFQRISESDRNRK